MSEPQPLPEIPQPAHWRGRLRSIVFAGLLILAPLYLTVYVLRVLFGLMDGIFAPIIDHTLNLFIPGFHVPGLGLLLTVCVVLFLGWLSRKVVGRRILDGVESMIRRIPVAKSVYGATKGVLEAVSRDQAEAFKRVVLVEYPRTNLFALGFVTSGNADWQTADPRTADLVSVFVPTTPNPTSGFLLLVPPAEIIECPISVEEGVRMIVSGGILQPELIAGLARPAAALGRLEPAIAGRLGSAGR